MIHSLRARFAILAISIGFLTAATLPPMPPPAKLHSPRARASTDFANKPMRLQIAQMAIATNAAIVAVPASGVSVDGLFAPPFWKQVFYTNFASAVGPQQAWGTNWLPFVSLAIAERAPTPIGPWTEFARAIIPTNLVPPGDTNRMHWTVPVTNSGAAGYVRFSATLPAN